MTMIDEGWLVAALQDLGGALEVPGDGPARVLAARDEPTRSERSAPLEPSPRRRRALAGIALAAVALLVVATLVVRGSRSTSTTTAGPVVHAAGGGAADSFAGTNTSGGVAASGPVTSVAAASGPVTSVAAASGPVTSVAAASGPAAKGLFNGQSAPAGVPVAPSGVPAPASGVAPSSPSTPAAPPGVPAKVVKTGSLELQVATGKLSPTVDQLTSQASSLGGYTAAAKTTEGTAGPVGDLTLRVPADRFETLLNGARAMGRPLAVSTSGQDVTAASVDLDARIHALQDTRAQFLLILSKATAIGDILSVQQQISSLQTEIEQLQGQQKVLADQATLATLSIHLSEPGSVSVIGPIPRPPHGLARAWAHARHSFAHGIEGVIGASGGVLVFLLFAGLVLLAGRLAWPRIRRFLV